MSFLICRVHEDAAEADVFDIRRFLRLELYCLASRLDAVALDDGIRPKADDRARRHDEKAMRMIETIRRMATDTVTIPELAKEFGLAVRTIELRFKEATGHSIRDEIQSLRLERAKVLLSQPRIKMSEVAAASGYPSLLAFRKTFKRLTGAAPGKWRKVKQPGVHPECSPA